MILLEEGINHFRNHTGAYIKMGKKWWLFKNQIIVYKWNSKELIMVEEGIHSFKVVLKLWPKFKKSWNFKGKIMALKRNIRELILVEEGIIVLSIILFLISKRERNARNTKMMSQYKNAIVEN